MSYWVTADKYIEYYIQLRGITREDLDVGPVVVLSWSPGVVKRMAEQVGAEPSEHWPMQKRYPLYTGDLNGVRVSFAHLTRGAPLTVTQMEQTIACGARVLLGLGWAGSLNPRAPIGSLVVPTMCIREEGTSAHYVAQDVVVRADPRIVTLLEQAAQAENMPVNVGPHWSTDAMYREEEDKIAAYRDLGMLSVDMETSAMVTLGQVRDVAVGNLLVVSDTLWNEWTMAFHSDTIREATKQAEQVILRALEVAVTRYKEGMFER